MPVSDTASLRPLTLPSPEAPADGKGPSDPGAAPNHPSTANAPGPYERLLAGEVLLFDGTEPEAERTIPAQWLEKAVALKRSIAIRNAVIVGEMNFSDQAFTESTEFVECTFVEWADFRRAEFPRLLNLSGTEFLQGASFTGARFRGDVLMSWARFRGGVADFNDAAFEGQLAASWVRFGKGVTAQFMRASFDRLAFFRRTAFGGPLQMFGAVCRGHLDLYRTYFADEADFDNLSVAGNALFGLARFCGRTAATFRLLQVGGQAIFENARFAGGANFRDCRISSALFSGMTSKGRLSFAGGEISNAIDLSDTVIKEGTESESSSLVLDGARITKDLYLRRVQVAGELRCIGLRVGQQLASEDVTIDGPADFFEAIVSQGAFFEGATFKSDVAFPSAQIERMKCGRNPESGRTTSFAGHADFAGCVVDQLQMADVDFSSPTAEVRFDHARIGRRADFSGTFANGASFTHATFGGNALFRARFDGPVSFDGCQFDGHADFSPLEDAAGNAHDDDEVHGGGSSFGSLSLCNARCRGQVRLQQARFTGALNLQGAELASLLLPARGASRTDARLPATIDMRRCSFDQVTVDWTAFHLGRDAPSWVRAPMGQPPRIEPYDRASYARLEAAFRRAGDDRIANRVHLERRRLERASMLRRRQWGSWLLSMIYLLIANYGIRPVRLMAYTAILILAGTIYFSQPKTVEPIPDKQAPSRPTVTRGPLTAAEAFGVTLNYFLPGNVPMSDNWRPVAQSGPVEVTLRRRTFDVDVSPATLATILKVCGWILVPFGIGAITGVLRRAQTA